MTDAQPDPATTDAPPAPAGTDAPTNPPADPPKDNGGEPKTYTPEETAAYIARLKDEAKGYRTSLSASKSEAEAALKAKDEEITRLTETLTTLQGEAYGNKVEAIKAKYGITDEDAKTYFLTDDLEKIEAVAKALSERSPQPKTPLFGGAPVRREGQQAPPAAAGDTKALLKGLFG